jgi:hypothetical protein
MTPVEWGVVVGAGVLVALVNWWFFGAHPRRTGNGHPHH